MATTTIMMIWMILIAILVFAIIVIAIKKGIYSIVILATVCLVGVIYLLLNVPWPEKTDDTPEPEITNSNPVEPAPSEDPGTGSSIIVVTDVEIEKLFDYPKIKEDFGEPMNLSYKSLRPNFDDRVKNTGFVDAVTYSEATEEEKAKENWIEQFIRNELRSNPAYADMIYSALKDIGLMTERSKWSQAYNLNRHNVYCWVEGITINSDGNYEIPEGIYEKIEKGEDIKLSEEYNWYSSELAWLFLNNPSTQNLGIHTTKEGWQILKQYALDGDAQKIYVDDKNVDNYPFYVFQFDWKNGTKAYIGINTKDYRALILKRSTPSAQPTKKYEPKPNPTPNPTSNPNPSPTPNPTPKPKPDCGTPDDSPNAPDEIKDNNLTDPEPTTSAWPSTPTVIVGDDTSDRKPKDSEPVIDPTADVIDQNRPDYSPIPVHDTLYVDEGTGQTYSAQNEPINNGTVDPF